MILLYVGRLGREKNLHVLKSVMDRIDALRKSDADIPHIELVFVGSGPAEQELKDLFKELANVVFTGQLTGNVN